MDGAQFEALFHETHQDVFKFAVWLTGGNREMLVLRYVFEWQVKDIAEWMRKKPNTVSVSLTRILSVLEARWEIASITGKVDP